MAASRSRSVAGEPVEGEGHRSGSRPVSARVHVTPKLPARFFGLEEIGRGGNGVVYRVHDAELGSEAAVKTFYSLDPAEAFFLKREFRALADIKHPNLVDLHELFVTPDATFFSMELVPGVDLLTHVRAITDRTARHAAIEELAHQLALGLLALHTAGRLHRDVKPTNVLVTPAGRVVILDFGLVAPLDPSRAWVSELEGFVGTALYMAPEQAWGRTLSPASDWYSFGAVLFEAVAGELPIHPRTKDFFGAKSDGRLTASLPPDTPARLARTIDACLAPSPANRPPGEAILELLGFKTPARVSRAPEPATHAAIPLVGRAAELERLTRTLESASAGRATVSYVHGSSGMGKTELVRAFLEKMQREREVTVLRGRCHPRENVAHNALDGVVDELSQLFVGRPDLSAPLKAELGVLRQQFPVLARALVDAEPDAAPAAAELPSLAEPSHAARKAALAFSTILATLAASRPVVVWIDDAQWGDADSGALLRHALRGDATAAAVHFVLSFRSDSRSMSATLAALGDDASLSPDEVALGPLNREESTALVRSALPSEGLAPDLVDSVVEEAGGSPLFLWELARHAAQRLAEPRPGQPITFRDALHSRLSALPAESRALIEVASVAGGPLQQSVLLQAAGMALSGRPLCARLESDYLLRSSASSSGRAYEIYHHRIQDELLAELDNDARCRHHGSIALALLAEASPNLPAVVDHYQAAGDMVSVRRYLVAAARQAVGGFGYELGARLYRLALEIGGTELTPLDLHVELARALAGAGRCFEAGRAFEEAAVLAGSAEPATRRAQVLLRRASEQFLRSGHAKEGAHAIDAALNDLGVRFAAERGVALLSGTYVRARLWARGLDFDVRSPAELDQTRDRLELMFLLCLTESRVNHSRSAAVSAAYLLEALQSGDAEHVLRALCVEATTASALPFGFARRASGALMKRALEILPSVESEFWRNAYDLARGFVAYFSGDLRSAAEHLEQSARVYRAYGSRACLELAMVEGFRLPTLAHLGKLREVARSYDGARLDAELRDDRFLLLNLPARQVCLAYLADADVERARAHADAALAQAPESYSSQHYDYFLAASEIDLYEGDAERAWSRVEEHWPKLKKNQFLMLNLLRDDLTHTRGRAALSLLGKLPAGDRRRRPLLAVARASSEALERNGLLPALGWSHALRAGVAELEGREHLVIEHLREALRRFTDAGMELYVAAVSRQLGERTAAGEASSLLQVSAESFRRERVVDAKAWLRLLSPGLRLPG